MQVCCCAEGWRRLRYSALFVRKKAVQSKARRTDTRAQAAAHRFSELGYGLGNDFRRPEPGQRWSSAKHAWPTHADTQTALILNSA